ncbi:hypothetical protein [Streptomyces sp. NPDC060188]|uniref:hypothetical protein n=1 Tax=Streptomyces sp. NPDC060188 TaxID=3347068 RepID=UPI00365C97C5
MLSLRSLRSLRTRWPSFLGCFGAVALGVAVMTAMGLGLAAARTAVAVRSQAPPRRTPVPAAPEGRAC